MTDKTILLVIPILIIQLVLTIINIINIKDKIKTKTLNKTIWIIIILLGNIFGNICYMIIESDSDYGN